MGGWLAVGLVLAGASRADDGGPVDVAAGVPPVGVAAGVSSAAPCVPMGESAFRDLVASARESIDAEDLDGFERWSGELEDRVPCLTFVPAPADWAAWLVAVAAVDHFRGRDWQTPLATALDIDPEVDRLVGPGHEIATWFPAPAARPVGEVPRRVELYVDGSRVEAMPAPVGLHLVQIRTEVGFTSRLLRDEPVPPEWLARPRAEAAPVALVASAAVGLARQGQVVDPPGAYADDWRRDRPDAGVHARIRVGAPIGILAEITATAARPVDGWFGASARSGWGSVGLGIAAATVVRREGEDTLQQLLVAPSVTGTAWTAGPTTIDGGASLGLGPALGFAALRGGITPAGEGIRLRFGLEGRLARAGYEQPGSGRTLAATDLRLLAQTGFLWGMW